MGNILVPIIDFTHMTDKERAEGRNIAFSLTEMGSYVDDFEAVLSLFDFCEAQMDRVSETGNFDSLKEITAWQRVAARDGAMTIWHFSKTIAGIKNSLRLCPSLNAYVDKTKFKSSSRLFNEKFGRHENMQHAVAHSGELTSSPNSHSKNSLDGKYPGVTISFSRVNNIIIKDCFQGKLYTTTGFLITPDTHPLAG